MATFSTSQIIYGLTGTARPVKQNSNSPQEVGVPQASASFSGKPIYAIGLTFGKAGDEITLNPLTGVLSGASGPSAAQINFEIAINPANNDTLTIGATVYTFKTTAAIAGDVQIGATAPDTAANLVDEINGDGIGGADPLVSGFAVGENIGLQALVAGADGNEITLDKSNPTSWFGLTSHLIGGSDGTIARATEGNGTDCEGEALPSATDNPAFLMTVTAGRVKATDGADFCVKAGAITATAPGFASLGADALTFAGDITISCVDPAASGLAFATLNLLLEPA